jgi:hypothetical protein
MEVVGMQLRLVVNIRQQNVIADIVSDGHIAVIDEFVVPDVIEVM